jgi:hypothetical protein
VVEHRARLHHLRHLLLVHAPHARGAGGPRLGHLHPRAAGRGGGERSSLVETSWGRSVVGSGS